MGCRQASSFADVAQLMQGKAHAGLHVLTSMMPGQLKMQLRKQNRYNWPLVDPVANTITESYVQLIFQLSAHAEAQFLV